jgi:phosphatidylglycerol:prolipoprotein diacylglycerol transferase
MLQIAALTFPQFDPVALELGPLAIRWYALAYIVGILLAWWYCRRLAERPDSGVTRPVLDDLVFWAVIGVVLGGRIGYVLVYNFDHFIQQPLDILRVWEGGMSFHGGMVGVLLAIGFVARKHRLRYFQVSDVVGCATPIGLFLGRLANFVNGELYGRASDAPWAMVFPTDPSALPRHPSQLYQAALEGLVLFAVLFLLVRLGRLKQVGFLSGAFLAGYGLARILGEFFREPDPQLGFLFGPVTMGQLLSLPMVLVGIWFMARARPPAVKA